MYSKEPKPYKPYSSVSCSIAHENACIPKSPDLTNPTGSCSIARKNEWILHSRPYTPCSSVVQLHVEIHGFQTAQNSPDQPRAAQSSPDQPRTTQSSPDQPRAAQSSPEQPRTAQSIPKQPRAAQNSPKQPRAAQNSPAEQPRAAHSSPSQPQAYIHMHLTHSVCIFTMLWHRQAINGAFLP